ncbi:MAG: LacI family DNA-binding transcriptional regulator [Tepidisphaeraceae bacterium]
MSIVEVAKAAGVSTATVSRVLNGLPGVRAETIAQVKAAVDELAYKPQRVRVARKRTPRGTKLRTGNIAVITLGHGRSWLEWPVLASVVGGIQRATQGHDLRLILGEMPDVSKPSPLMTDRQIDGAIVFMSSDVPVVQYEATLKAMMKHVPVVWAMGMEIAAGGVDHVTSDNVGIGHAAYAPPDQARL